MKTPNFDHAPQARPPQVWVLTTEKLGDNAQVRAIADALGWPYELKRLDFTGVNHFHFRLFGPSLRNLAVERSASLMPPWPDLLLTIGRRATPVALWIRQQSEGKTKLVLVGQPRVGFACFDLVEGHAREDCDAVIALLPVHRAVGAPAPPPTRRRASGRASPPPRCWRRSPRRSARRSASGARAPLPPRRRDTDGLVTRCMRQLVIDAGLSAPT